MTREFWMREGLSHITPANKTNPEGWDVWTLLGSLARGSVVEIGCGYGRLCTAFEPSHYLGTDINPAAIQQARKLHPAYTFEPYTGQAADTALLYTVLLHIPDADLAGLIAGISADRVIVAEVMGRHWRRAGNPPVFNREPEEYIEAFGGKHQRIDKPYAHYPNTDITFLVIDKD